MTAPARISCHHHPKLNAKRKVKAPQTMPGHDQFSRYFPRVPPDVITAKKNTERSKITAVMKMINGLFKSPAGASISR